MNTKKDHLIADKTSLERIKNLRLMDPVLMTNVFEDFSCMEFLLRTALHNNNVRVLGMINRYHVVNFHEPGVLLNVLAIDDCWPYVMDIEIRTRAPNDGLAPEIYKHFSFNEAVSDCILRNDLRVKPCSIYFDRDQEFDVTYKSYLEKHLEDYLNDPYEIDLIYRVRLNVYDETDLMHDFHCSDPDEMIHSLLAERVRFFKETVEGQKILIEDLEREEGKESMN